MHSGTICLLKECNAIICNRVAGKGDLMLSEINQPQKAKKSLISLRYRF